MQPVDRYRIEIYYSPQDGHYIARVPDVRYVMGDGATHEEALANAKSALSAVLDMFKDEGSPFPQPTLPPPWLPESSEGRASGRRKRAMASRKAKARATPAAINGSRQKNVRR